MTVYKSWTIPAIEPNVPGTQTLVFPPGNWITLSEQGFPNTELRRASTLLQFSINPGTLHGMAQVSKGEPAYILISINKSRRLIGEMEHREGPNSAPSTYTQMTVKRYIGVENFPGDVQKLARDMHWPSTDQQLLYEISTHIPDRESPEVTIAFAFNYQ